MKPLLGAVVLAVTFGLPVGATATTIQVTGSVTSITNDTPSLTLDGSVVVGTAYVATYTYSPFLVDPFGTPQDATYSPMMSFQLAVGDYVIVPGIAGGGSIRILNDFPLFGDGYQANFGNSTVQAGSFGGTPDSIGGSFVWLQDPTGTALSSNALQIPDPSKFLTAFWQLDANQSPGEEPHRLRITGSISSITEITETPVPEPATGSLLAVGSLLVMLRRRVHERPRRYRRSRITIGDGPRERLSRPSRISPP
jgi:hypothetical protein